MKTTFVALLGALLLLHSPTAAFAAAQKLQQAKQLFKQGDVLYRQGHFERALKHYQKALTLARRPSIVLNIGQCHRQLGNHQRALFFYKLYLADWQRAYPDKPPRYEADVRRYIVELTQLLGKAKAEAERQRLAKLARGRLSIQNAPPGAVVRVDDVYRGQTPLGSPLSLQVGKHRVRITADGHQRWEETLEIQANKLATLTAALKLTQPKRKKLWLVGGISTGALAVGMEIMALVFRSKANKEIDQSSEFKKFAAGSISGHVLAGSFAVASGISWYLWYRSGKPSGASERRVTLAPTRGGLILAGRGQF